MNLRARVRVVRPLAKAADTITKSSRVILPLVSTTGTVAAAALAGVLLVTSSATATIIYNLGTIGGTYSNGLAINDNRQVAGQSQAGSGNYHAFRYDGAPGSGGIMRDLGTLGGMHSIAYAVNNAGQVAGGSQITGDAAYHAFRYDGTPASGGVMRDLGNFGGDTSEAHGINNAGQVVGFSQTIPNNTSQHAFRYDGTPGSGGVMRDLGTLGGSYSGGIAINEAGQVTGYSSRFTGGGAPYHAFRYDGTPGSGGIMRDLGTLGGPYSQGRDINNAGQVVGFSDTSHDVDDPGRHAFLYLGTPGVNGQMIDLDTWLNANNPAEGAKWKLESANGISETGWITGGGEYDPDGPGGLAAESRAFLLDASSLVPEPSGLGLLTLTVPAWFRRRDQSL